MDLKWLLFSFKGRLNRAPYWGVALVMFVLGVGFNFAIGDIGPESPVTTGPTLLETLLVVFVCWVGLAVQIKRWHDRDKSAWWALINLVPVVGSLWVLVECGFLRGSAGPNRFGVDPLGAPGQSSGPASNTGAG